MKMNLKNLSMVLGIVISMSTIIYGTIKFLDASYADAADYKQHKLNTKYEFLHIKLDKIKERIWILEIKLEKQPNNKDIKKELEELKSAKEKTSKIIDDIEKIKLQE